MQNRFIPDFSFNHVGALYRSAIHSAVIRSAAITKLKSAPARGGGWDALEAPLAKRPGEFASKRGVRCLQ